MIAHAELSRRCMRFMRFSFVAWKLYLRWSEGKHADFCGIGPEEILEAFSLPTGVRNPTPCSSPIDIKRPVVASSLVGATPNIEALRSLGAIGSWNGVFIMPQNRTAACVHDL
jgi:hypothetical protein